MPAGALVTVPVPVPLRTTLSANCVGGGVPELKLAVAVSAEVMVSAQLPIPEQAPLQPVKVEPALGVAMSVIVEPPMNGEKQMLPQSKPSGEEVTRPVPVPALVIVSDGGGVMVNTAPTLLAAFRVTLQLPVPEQAPLQPVKVEPEAGVAVRPTLEP